MVWRCWRRGSGWRRISRVCAWFVGRVLWPVRVSWRGGPSTQKTRVLGSTPGSPTACEDLDVEKNRLRVLEPASFRKWGRGGRGQGPGAGPGPTARRPLAHRPPPTAAPAGCRRCRLSAVGCRLSAQQGGAGEGEPSTALSGLRLRLRCSRPTPLTPLPLPLPLLTTNKPLLLATCYLLLATSIATCS
jgi:hypothetical protein